MGMLLDEEVMGGGKPFCVVQGKVYVIDGDKFITEDDPKGDAKIDKFGNLLSSVLRVLPPLLWSLRYDWTSSCKAALVIIRWMCEHP